MISVPRLHGGLFLFGTPAEEVLTGTSGNDIMVGGAGADTYEIGHKGGHDIIFGFQSGVDTLALAASPRTVQATDTADGLVISYGSMGSAGHHTITLMGVHKISATDYDWG